MDLLKRAIILLVIDSAVAFNIAADIPSSFVAFDVSRVHSISRTSSTVLNSSSLDSLMSVSTKVEQSSSESERRLELKHCEKKLFSIDAFSPSFEMISLLLDLRNGILLSFFIMNLVAFQNAFGLDTFRDLKYPLLACFNLLATAFFLFQKPVSGSAFRFGWHTYRKDS